MTLILDGRPHAAFMKQELKKEKQKVFGWQKIYMAIIFVWENSASTAYVKFKKKFGEDIGIGVEVFGQDLETNFEHLQIRKQRAILSEQSVIGSDTNTAIQDNKVPEAISQQSGIDEIIQLINFLNNDSACVGIIIQLPLPHLLWKQSAHISKHIHPSKDIDAMGPMLYGMDSFAMIDFLGATPQAAMTLLKQYNLDNVRGKIVSIVWQSNLIGKPLATHLMKKWATVLSFNSKSPKQAMQELCQRSDYIFACTGIVHVIDQHYINDKRKQIVVDIGYGYKDGKPVGDVQLDIIKDMVAAYTPIPGWVWPLTVANLFANIFKLHKHFLRS
jgi:methylenetetrahydrofolate dehydrogenase (NADP+)/methenyltetrahydrofolate cyclohydrolase